MKQENEIQQCCPQFDPEPWDEKEFVWENKRFITDSVFTIFHMPINLGAAMRRMSDKCMNAEAPMTDWLCLSEFISQWKMNLYLAVDRKVEGADNETISGKFISKVYEGPFKDSGKWMKDFQKYVGEKGKTAQRNFVWYTTCPKCAKKFGKNYVVQIAQIA
jgi:hypothetical protein